MSAGDEALRNATVAHAESPEVLHFSGITKRIAMEHDSLRWRVSPRREPQTNTYRRRMMRTG